MGWQSFPHIKRAKTWTSKLKRSAMVVEKVGVAFIPRHVNNVLKDAWVLESEQKTEEKC
jgi:hypothetical protein